jgi:hypothetical protein
MIVTNLSVYKYFLKNSSYPVEPGGTLTVDNAVWASDDELARTIESLDNFNIAAVSERPVNYPRTRSFPEVLNLIGGGGSQTITRAQYDLALADVPTNTPTKLPFAFNYGTELFDLTDPTDPTPVESGTYSFGVTVAISNVGSGSKWYVIVALDYDDFAGTMSQSQEITGQTGAQAITFPFYVPAGSPCHVKVTHDSSDQGGADFSGHVYLQRFS